MVVLFVVSYLRTERDVSSIDKCSSIDWALIGILVGVSIIIAIWGILLVVKDIRYKREIEFPHVSGDLPCTPKLTIILSSLAFIGAFLSSGFGLSGGLLYTPLLGIIGQVPQVASATAQYLMLYVTFSHSVVSLINGNLLWDYAINLAVATCIGSFPGIYF